MAIDEKKALKTFAPWKIILAIALGLGFTGWMMYNEISNNTDKVEGLFTSETNYFWLFMAFAVMVLRDIGYMYRIKTITEGQLSWKSSFYVIILWEFASAVTPSVVGGTLVAIFIINNEGIAFGKSLAYVMLTAILDNMFFIVFGPLVILWVGFETVSTQVDTEYFGTIDLFWLFSVSYILIALYTVFMAWGVFFSPKSFQRFLMWMTKFRLFKRFRKKAETQGAEVVLASERLKGKKITYWLKVILSTIFVWSARYLVVNCLLAAFTDAFSTGGYTHVEAYAKQVVLWIAQLVSITPGAAGFAEYFFMKVYEGYTVSGRLISIAFIWRLITYYPYLILGAIFLPRWLKKIAKRKAQESAAKEQALAGSI